MNIGIYTDTYYPELNGVATSVYTLKRGLESAGHSVYVFTVSAPADAAPDAERDVFRIKSLPFLMLRERRVGMPVPAKWIKKARDLKLDIIHTQTEFSVGMLGRITAKRLGIPSVCTYHTIYEEYSHYLRFLPVRDAEIKRGIRTMSRRLCDGADAVIVPSDKTLALLRDYGVKSDIHVCPTGIDTYKFRRRGRDATDALRRRCGINEGDVVLVSLGRLSREKNISELVGYMPELVRRDSRVRLVIVGDGPEADSLASLVRALSLEEHVVLTGAAPWDEVQDYYSLGAIFVSASVSETQGLTYLEAMACGLPVIARRDDCLKSLIESGKNGFTYTDKAGFLNAYLALTDDERREQVSAAARMTAESFGTDAFASDVHDIYEDLVKNNKRVKKRIFAGK